MSSRVGSTRRIKMYKYSAVLTSFNAEKSLVTAIESIFMQTVAPIELIIVDDCSTDESFQLARKQQVVHPEIKVIRNEKNMGVSFSRNLAVSLAKEEIIVFFDDDDQSLSHRATEHLKNIGLGADISYVSSSKKYPNGYRVMNISKDYFGSLNSAHFAKYQLLGGESLFAVPASCMAIKREKYLAAGGFDVLLRRLEDVDFSIRMAGINSMFSFSSLVCVTRFDLGGPNSKFEGPSQRLILEKYKHLLSDYDFKEALFKTEVRDLYFNRRLPRLVLRLIWEIIVHPQRINYLTRGILRMKHDWSKG
jgi:glycosyltransferase involved in cell wall biosynthesis